VPSAVADLQPVPGTVVDPGVVLEVVLGTVAVLLPVPETVVDPGVVLEAVLGTVVDPEVVPGTVVDPEVVPGTEVALGVGPGTEAGPEVALVADPGTEVALEVGPGTEADLVAGTEAVPAFVEEVEHSWVVAEEACRAQTVGELAGLELTHASALRSCPHQASGAPCGAGGNPGDSLRGDHSQLGAWRGCWGRGNPGASDPWPSSSAPPPASAAQSLRTPPL